MRAFEPQYKLKHRFLKRSGFLDESCTEVEYILPPAKSQVKVLKMRCRKLTTNFILQFNKSCAACFFLSCYHAFAFSTKSYQLTLEFGQKKGRTEGKKIRLV